MTSEELKQEKEIAILSSIGKVLDEYFQNESDEIRQTAIRCWRGGFEEGAEWMFKRLWPMFDK